MELTITPNEGTKTIANIPAGDAFTLPEYEDRVYQVLYHQTSTPVTVCLCFRDGKAPERADLSTNLRCSPVRFTSAVFEHC